MKETKTDQLSMTAAVLLMAAVAVARGSSFIFSKQLLRGMEPLNLLGIRSLLAFLVLMLFFGRRVVNAIRGDIGVLKAGVMIGFVYFLIMTLELNPLTTAVLGAIVLGEFFGIAGLAGASLIIGGIIIHNKSSMQSSRSRDLSRDK